MTCCRRRLPEISNSGDVDLVYWPKRLRWATEKAISGSRNANARKTWNLRQSDMVLDHTKSTGKEQMSISVMMSKAVITCQRRNCFVANVRLRVFTPRYIYLCCLPAPGIGEDVPSSASCHGRNRLRFQSQMRGPKWH